MFPEIKMWHKISPVGSLDESQSTRVTDRRTDGQNYDFQDRASIAASRGNNNHSGTVSVNLTRASVFMIRNGSLFF